MKIQNTNSNINNVNISKLVKTSDSSFKNVLINHIENEKSEKKLAAKATNTIAPEQIDYSKHLMVVTKERYTVEGVKNIIKDAFSNNEEQILNEIEALIGDESGENIDVSLLDELLQLYSEVKI